MATRYAVANGNWSSLAVWDGGASLPGVNDDVYADGKTVTIDQNITVLTLRTTNRGGGTAGGGFTISSVYTITAELVHGTGTIITCSHAVGEVLIIGNFTIGAAPYGNFISNTNTGDIKVVGNVLADNGNNNHGIYNTNTGNVTVIGSVQGGSSTDYNRGIYNESTGNITITGNVSAGLSGVNTQGVFLNNTCALNVTGNVTANISQGILAGSASVITINGDLYSGIRQPAVIASLGSLTLKGNMYGYNNIFPIKVLSFHSDDSTPSLIILQNIIGNNRTFYTADLPLGNPATSDVRDGVLYGAALELEGDLIVPPPASVALNVPTDHTVGTLEMSPADFWSYANRTLTSGGGGITAADVWDHLLTAIATPGSIGDLIKTNLDGQISDIPVDVVTEFNISLVDVAVRMQNASTVETTGDQIAALP
jgi:hypothetical protein